MVNRINNKFHELGQKCNQNLNKSRLVVQRCIQLILFPLEIKKQNENTVSIHIKIGVKDPCCLLYELLICYLLRHKICYLLVRCLANPSLFALRYWINVKFNMNYLFLQCGIYNLCIISRVMLRRNQWKNVEIK